MSTPTTQSALVIPAKLADFTVSSVQVPKPAPDEVLVRIEATALNPLEWKIQEHGLFVKEYPVILGLDAAGVVVEIGSNVTTRKVGDKIMFLGDFLNHRGTYQQYVTVPEEITSQIPPQLSFDEAATIPTCFATVALALWNQDPRAAEKSARYPAIWEEGGKAAFAGKPVLIFGGSSSVGQFAIQIAKLCGHFPIITTASLHNTPLLSSLGATHIVDRSLPAAELLSKIASIVGDKLLLHVYDAIATPDTQIVAYDALSPGGTAILTLPVSLPEEKLAEGEKVGKRAFLTFGSYYGPESRQLGIEICKRLPGWIANGDVKPNPFELLPHGLAGIPEGLARLKANKVSAKKLVAHPQETQ